MRRGTKKKDYSDFIHANLEVAWIAEDLDEVRCLCPLHEENEPSFSINRRTGLWFCHSEQRGGGIRQLRLALREVNTNRIEDTFPNMRRFGSALR
jgi:hypothetical protein